MRCSFFILCLVLIVLSTNSCKKIKYYPDKAYGDVETKVLAHRGGGNSAYQENTLEAADYGMASLDGIEVDIQISKDRTIWMAHNAGLPDCEGVSYDCFPETYDSQIIELDSCLGNSFVFSRLEEVFDLMVTTYPDKFISLDVKAWEPCAATSLSIMGVMNAMADEIIQLTEKYKLHDRVMVESETATFLNYMKKKSDGIETYLTTLGDFERGMQLALKSGYSGLSFKYKFDEEITEDHIYLIRKKGLKIQLWTVDEAESIEEALSINPDFIQTNNMNYFVNYLEN